MISSTISTLALLVASASVASAAPFDNYPTHHITSMLRRQEATLGGFEIPQLCATGCAPIEPIYDSCLANDLTGCLVVCREGKLDEFMNCMNCLLVNGDPVDVTRSAYSVTERQWDGIVRGCSSRGYGYPPTVGLVNYDQIGSNYTSSGASSTSAGTPTTQTDSAGLPSSTGAAAAASSAVSTGGAASRVGSGGAGVFCAALLSVGALMVSL